ncbi:MAG: phosphomethylpyrimidine synthase [Candidatus Margulisbacteria bacterium GWF2_35_9]|nr:MAG: phosphomethylpyrimidine synthase [Candidatus Margulisbacteria bacterium GWF2_35_9]
MIKSNIIADSIYTEISEKEDVSVDALKKLVESGEVVIFNNQNHKNLKPVAVGKGMKIKINANIGISPMCSDQEKELAKVRLCEEYEVDAIMDLSLGENIRQLRQNIINSTYIPVGTVPLYECFYYHKDYPENMIDHFLKILDESGQDGVDFVVIHAGLLQEHLELVKSRIIKVTSRGGSLLMKWMKQNNKENFLYTHFDKILQICKKYNMTISLGDGMRPATVIDETDAAQIEELKNIGDLILRCREAGVQALVEGPGHIPFHKIKENVDLQKKYCHNAPFYVLGPLVTDIAPGYDHITSAIGATMAAHCGADFLCYVTPAEHISLPDLEDVREGIVAFKIAAHAINISRGKDISRDRKMSIARSTVDWETQRKYVIDKTKFDKYLQRVPQDVKVCTMCGDFCALK